MAAKAAVAAAPAAATVMYIARERGMLECSSRRYARHPMSCLVRDARAVTHWKAARWACGVVFAHKHLYYVATGALAGDAETCIVVLDRTGTKQPLMATLCASDGVYALFKITGVVPVSTVPPIVVLDGWKAPKASLEYSVVTAGRRRVPYNARDWVFELDGAVVLGADHAPVGMYAQARIVPFQTMLDAIASPSIKPVQRPRVALWGRYLLVDDEPVCVVTTGTKPYAKLAELYEDNPDEARWDIGEWVRRGLDVDLWTRVERERGVLQLL